jgi:predicted nucleic acid-binding protein
VFKKYFYDSQTGLSFVSELELLSNPYFTKHDLESVQYLIAQHEVITYEPELKEIIINIRSKKKVKIPDAIIAATAMYLKVPLVTADKGFNNIDGLDIILHDPASI